MPGRLLPGHNMKIGGSYFLKGVQTGVGPSELLGYKGFRVPPVTLDSGRSPATLRVYVAAISSQHARVDNDTVGRHGPISLFLRGAWRLRPPRAQRAPAWDLRLVLDALCLPPPLSPWHGLS